MARFISLQLPALQRHWEHRGGRSATLRGVPEAKTNLVALRTERDRCVDILSEAFARDLLDVDEFERRIDLVHKADSVASLVSLREDLEGIETTDVPSEALVAVTSAEEPEALTVAQPTSGWCIGILGAAERKGQWRVPKKLRVTAIMGGVELDFREAILPPGITYVQVFSCMGGVDILVPPNVAVECNGMGIMGAFESMERSPVVPDPGKPLLRISGGALMGAVEIETRLVGESARDAKKRRKRERKAKKKQLTSGES